MIKSLALLPKSADLEDADNLRSKLILSLKHANGLVEIKRNEGPLMSPGGPPSYAMVIEASWESLEHFMAWTQTSAAHP